jgi:hypothetical protein
MKKKLTAVLVLAAMLVAGASAQLMIGVSGALPLDSSNTSVEQLSDQFQSGQGIFYGGFVELGMHQIGIGFSANTMTAKDPVFDANMQIIDADLYVAFHIFGARALLDPFAELGYGVIGSEWENGTDWVDASYYWYGALGLGVNLGPVGVFAKFAYNNAVSTPVKLEDDSNAPPFGSYLFNDLDGYLPRYRVTIAAKLIL